MPDLSSPEERLAGVREIVRSEPEPLVTLTHLLRLCRDEHPVLWASISEIGRSQDTTQALRPVREALPEPDSAMSLSVDVRQLMAAALDGPDDVQNLVVAHSLAQLIDSHYGLALASSFARRSPYQPRVGDPIPLDGLNLPQITALPPTSPPWRLAQRLDQTRHVRLAGEWAAQFRVVFDYGPSEALAGVLDRATVLATCHPNSALTEFRLCDEAGEPSFPVEPRDGDRQRAELDRLIRTAVDSGASIVVLPELSVSESLAAELQDWVRRPNGLRLLLAGSFHHTVAGEGRHRKNTAIAWVRDYDRPLTHDKHSPADRPVHEDLQPQGWPELRVYVTADGCHLVIAICRDLLNPHAVHALAEVGATLVLVPAMSETLMPFGGPVAQLVADNQAVVAVANNPAIWATEGKPVARPARALFGHPGFGQQSRAVAAGEGRPGVARLDVRSGEVNWLTDAERTDAHRPDATPQRPAWVERLTAETIRPWSGSASDGTVGLRAAAALVLLTPGAAGPQALLTERSADLADYPGQFVFPGGAAEAHDAGLVATALREATEEVGLEPESVEIIGLLPAFALPESGFMLTPVLAWSPDPRFPRPSNLAEVSGVRTVPLYRPPPARYGRVTAAVLDMLRGMVSGGFEERTPSGEEPGPPLASHPRSARLGADGVPDMRRRAPVHPAVPGRALGGDLSEWHPAGKRPLLDRPGWRTLRADPTGIVVAAVFALQAMTPSLLPRSWLFQAVVSGISASIGYGLGVLTAVLARHVRGYGRLAAWAARTIPPPARRAAWTALLAGVPMALVVGLVVASDWQRETHVLIGMRPETSAHWLRAAPATVAIAAVIVAVFRSGRLLARWVARLVRRWIPLPRRLAQAIGAITAVLLVLGLVQGVALRWALSAADTAFSVSNTRTPPGVEQPMAPQRSGSLSSLSPWASLGRQGRAFVSGGPSRTAMARAAGIPEATVREPIRVYVGLTAKDTAEVRARLAVQELERAGAFDRAVLAVVTTTGTGWVDPAAPEALELLYGGNTAVVATQYSYLPSWLSFLVDRSRADEAGRTLFDAVYARLQLISRDRRPRLLVYGESLGSSGSESAFRGLTDLRQRADGVLWVGPPNSNRLWSQFVQRRDPGTREVAPEYAAGLVVRFADRPEELLASGQPWIEPRVAYLMHPSDPIVWWSPKLLFTRPDWLEEPRGRGVSPAVRWRPIVTF